MKPIKPIKTKSKSKLIASAILTSIMMLSITANAEELEINITSETSSITSSTSFNATEDVIGQALKVSIPADFALTYDEETELFTCDSELSVQGALGENKCLEITTDPTVEYIAESNSTIKVIGQVSFGVEGKETWTSDELKEAATNNSDTNTVAKKLFIQVDRGEIIYPDNYNSELVFNIQITDNT